jgi:hypothetical protein
MPRQGAPLLLRGGGVGEGVRVPHATCKWPYTRRLLARWSLSRHPARLLPTRGGGGHTWTSRSSRRLTAMGGPRTAFHRLISLSSFASTSANGFSPPAAVWADRRRAVHARVRCHPQSIPPLFPLSGSEFEDRIERARPLWAVRAAVRISRNASSPQVPQLWPFAQISNWRDQAGDGAPASGIFRM